SRNARAGLRDNPLRLGWCRLCHRRPRCKGRYASIRPLHWHFTCSSSFIIGCWGVWQGDPTTRRPHEAPALNPVGVASRTGAPWFAQPDALELSFGCQLTVAVEPRNEGLPMSEDECDKIEIVNRAEELLLRPREVARSIQEKLRKTMAAHG